MKTVSHIIAATLLSTGVAMANEEVSFDQNDENRDGYLSQSEWENAQVEVDFSEVDTNNDDYLTEQELQGSDKIQLQSASSQDTQTMGMGDSELVSDTVSDTGSSSSQVRFDEVDSNRDGFVGEDEWQDANIDVEFSEIDQDQDGFVSEDDLRASGRVDLSGDSAQGFGTAGVSGTQAGMSETGSDEAETFGTSDVQSRTDTEFGASSGLGELESQDHDRDGALSESEWQNVDVDVEFSDVDQDQDGRVTAQEIQQSDNVELQRVGSQSDQASMGERSGMSGRQSGMQQSGQQASARELDRNQDQMISEQEAEGNDYVVTNFQAWDTDRDGQVEVAVVEKALVELDSQQQNQSGDRSQDDGFQQ